MNKREVMKVENLVRNYKMVYSDRQGEEEIKVELNRCAMACEGCGAVFSLT